MEDDSQRDRSPAQTSMRERSRRQRWIQLERPGTSSGVTSDQCEA